MTNIDTSKICQKCQGTSFYRDQDNDLKCLTCGQIWRDRPLEVNRDIDRKRREADYSKLSAQQRADKRYRETELYKQTRRKHQKKYRESKKGKEARDWHKEKTDILSRILRRLEKAGWV